MLMFCECELTIPFPFVSVTGDLLEAGPWNIIVSDYSNTFFSNTSQKYSICKYKTEWYDCSRRKKCLCIKG